MRDVDHARRLRVIESRREQLKAELGRLVPKMKDGNPGAIERGQNLKTALEHLDDEERDLRARAEQAERMVRLYKEGKLSRNLEEAVST